MPSSFKDKVCLVTGAAKGIGRAICDGLAADGATICLADIDEQAVAASAAEIAEQHPSANVENHVLDVTDRAAVDALVETITAKHGRIDYVFNNAGINTMAELRDATPEIWQRIVDVNLWGVIHGTEAAYRKMAEQGHGHIVNIASGLGIVPAPRNIPYSTTKFAVVGLSESLRIEAKDLGVKVSVVCPGWIATPQVQKGNVMVGQRAAKVTIEDVAKFSLFSVAKSAKIILRGTLRNKPRIVFPGYVRWVWRLYRLCPPLADIWFRHEIRAFRKLRNESVDPVASNDDSSIMENGQPTPHTNTAQQSEP